MPLGVLISEMAMHRIRRGRPRPAQLAASDSDQICEPPTGGHLGARVSKLLRFILRGSALLLTCAVVVFAATSPSLKTSKTVSSHSKKQVPAHVQKIASSTSTPAVKFHDVRLAQLRFGNAAVASGVGPAAFPDSVGSLNATGPATAAPHHGGTDGVPVALTVSDANGQQLGLAVDLYGGVYVPSAGKFMMITTTSVPSNCGTAGNVSCTPVFGYPVSLPLYFSGYGCTGMMYSYVYPSGDQELYWENSGLYTFQPGDLLPYPTNSASYQPAGSSSCVNASAQIGGGGFRSVTLQPYTGTLPFTLPVAFPLHYVPVSK